MLHGARDYLWLHREAGQSGGNGGPGGVNSEPSLAGLAPPEGLDLGRVLASRRATTVIRYSSDSARCSLTIPLGSIRGPRRPRTADGRGQAEMTTC